MSSSSSDEEQYFKNKASRRKNDGEAELGRRIQDESSSEKKFERISKPKCRRRIIAMNDDSSNNSTHINDNQKEEAVEAFSQKNPIGKLVDSDIFDTEEQLDNVQSQDSGESCRQPVKQLKADIIKQNKKEKVRSKKGEENKKNAVDKSRKKGMDASEKRLLHSNSQRMQREARFQIPYREPPQRTLAEFLEHRKKTALPIPPFMKPTRAQLNKWLDSLNAPETAGTSHTQSVPRVSVPTVEGDNKARSLSIKEQIRKVKEDALRSGFVPKLTSDTDTLVYLDRTYNRGEGGLSEEANEFKKRLERQTDKPAPKLKLPDNPSGLIFNKDKGPKLLQLQKYLQVGIYKNRDERYAKKIAEFNLENEKRLKEEAEEESAEESDGEKELNEGAEDRDDFVDKEADEEGGGKYSCEKDEDAQKGELNLEKSISQNSEDRSFEFIGSMIAPFQPQRAQRCSTQPNESIEAKSLDDDEFCASQDLFATSQPAEIDSSVFPKHHVNTLQFTDGGSAASNEVGGATQASAEDELLMLCSGDFPQSQIDCNDVGPASDLDDKSSTSSSIGPTGPRVNKVKGRITYSEESECDSESDIDSEEEVEGYRHLFKTDKSAKHGNIRKEFVEEEAELSGSDASTDEDEDVHDDILEEELGDNDELMSEEELHDQVANIHRKIMHDEDKNNLMLLKEQYLDDGDLDGGTERPRQFRWKNIGDDFIETAPQSEQIDEGSDDEDDGQWRVEMHEREKWVAEQRLAEMKEQEKSNPKLIIPDAKDSIVPKSGTSYLPKSPQKLSTVGLRGSFLHRGKDVLDRIAKMTQKGFQNPKPMNSRNFVFAPLSPKMDQKNKAPVKRTSDAILNPELPNKQQKREMSVAAPKRPIPRKSIFDQF